jgi:carboxymethylenebutenolidase
MELIDLGALFDAHVTHEFVDRDVDATMNTMTAEPYLLHLPMLSGGEGRSAVRDFYQRFFVGKWPADRKVLVYPLQVTRLTVMH